MDYLKIVNREYDKIRFTQFKHHLEIEINLQELGLDEDLLRINSDLYFKQYAKLYKIQQRLIETVEELIDNNIDDIEYIKKLIKKNIKKKDVIPSKFSFMFVTVRPPDKKYTPSMFLECIHRAFNGRQYEMVVEQASDNEQEMGTGLHIHAIIERNNLIPPGEDKQGIFRKLSKIGNTKIDWHIDDHRQDKQHYMGKDILTCGNHIIGSYLSPTLAYWKDTDEKNKKLPIDFLYRKDNNINHYYDTCEDD